MVVGIMSNSRPMLCGVRCMIVVSCGASWWICGVVFAPLARYLAITHTYTNSHMQSKLTHHPQAHVQDRLTTPFSHASSVALCSASHVDMQAKLRTSVVDMWGTMWTICAWHAAESRDSETHYCAFFSWQAYIGYVIITVPSKGKSPVGNTQKS